MGSLLEQIEDKAGASVQRLLLTITGMIISIVGAIFLSVAAYGALTDVLGDDIAALTVGAALLVIGIVFALLGRRSGKRKERQIPQPQANAASLAQAFVTGMGAGSAVRQRR